MEKNGAWEHSLGSIFYYQDWLGRYLHKEQRLGRNTVAQLGSVVSIIPSHCHNLTTNRTKTQNCNSSAPFWALVRLALIPRGGRSCGADTPLQWQPKPTSGRSQKRAQNLLAYWNTVFIRIQFLAINNNNKTQNPLCICSFDTFLLRNSGAGGYNIIRLIPQGTVNNLGPGCLAGPKALDPNYCRQPILWLHDLCLEVLTVHGTDLLLFGGKAFSLLILIMSHLL